jgi:hypothetical protein
LIALSDICITLSYMKNRSLQIRLEPELTALVDKAVQRTGLSKSEVLRQGLRKGVPEVIRALESPPRKTIVDALLDLKGLEIRERRHGLKRRL